MLSKGHQDFNRIVSKLSIALSDNIFFNDNDIKCPLRYCPLRYNFLVRSLNNSEVQIIFVKGHQYFTRIVARLSTYVSNYRLILLYLRVIIFMSTHLPSTKKRRHEKMTLLYCALQRQAVTVPEGGNPARYSPIQFGFRLQLL